MMLQTNLETTSTVHEDQKKKEKEGHMVHVVSTWVMYFMRVSR